MERRKRVFPAIALLACVLLLPACSAGGEEPVEEETRPLILATVSGQIDREAVDSFNRAHPDTQIEVRDYSENGAATETGIKRLLTEITAGQIPDILEIGNNAHRLPMQQLAEKGYLEDLWPYIENDPELGRESLMEAPLKAAEISGGLYEAFSSVFIDTLVGAESTVGDRYSWTLDELNAAFAAMPEGSTVSEYCYTKQDMLFYLLSMSLDEWVDWDTGRCSFDREDFAACLEFIDRYHPLAFDWSDAAAVNEEIWRRTLAGQQMLTHYPITKLEDVQILDVVFGGRASFVGYPVADGGTGSFFCVSGGELAMSAVCRNKDAAWDFIRRMFLPQGVGGSRTGIPVNAVDFENWVKDASYERPTCFYYGTMPIELHTPTDEELDRFLDFFNRVGRFTQNDAAIFGIVKEQCGPYFAGDKTLDETAELIQNRVQLYVNENR